MSKSISVAVLMGGPSSERDISMLSGNAVAAGLEDGGYCVTKITVDDSIEPHLDILKTMDVVFVALHGDYGEDGTLQKELEAQGILYTGSDAVASKNAMDKLSSKRIFQAEGIKTPKYITEDSIFDVSRGVVVKPNSGGSSLGVKIVKDTEELEIAVSEARKYSDDILVEEFIEGRELTVGVIGEVPLEPIELSSPNEFYDYDAKYNSEETEYTLPAKLDSNIRSEVMALGLKAFQKLGCRDFGRTDIMLRPNGEAMVLEVNTIPGFTSHSLLPMAAKYAGINFTQLTSRIVEMALCRRDA